MQKEKLAITTFLLMLCASEQVLDLVPLADSVLKLHTRCHHVGCLRPAIFSMRITADTAQELVGGADKYMPACRVHYRGPAPEPHQAGEQQA